MSVARLLARVSRELRGCHGGGVRRVGGLREALRGGVPSAGGWDVAKMDVKWRYSSRLVGIADVP